MSELEVPSGSDLTKHPTEYLTNLEEFLSQALSWFGNETTLKSSVFETQSPAGGAILGGCENSRRRTQLKEGMGL